MNILSNLIQEILCHCHIKHKLSFAWIIHAASIKKKENYGYSLYLNLAPRIKLKIKKEN